MYINSHLLQVFPKPRFAAWFDLSVFLSKLCFLYWERVVDAENITTVALQPEKGA